MQDFALVSDSGYAAQNGGRIVRALQEIAISRKWGQVSSVLISMSKAIEKRMWPFDQPLKQFPLKADVLYNLAQWADDLLPSELMEMSATEIGKLIHLNEIHGTAVLNAAKTFPTLAVKYNLRPLGYDILKLSLRVARAFTWNSKVHGTVEPFWLWVEYEDGTILQQTQLLIRQNTDTLDVDFVISIPEGVSPPSVTVRYISDKWMGAEEEIPISFADLVMPPAPGDHTVVHNLPFLSISSCRDATIRDVFSSRISNFNSIQTHVLWSLLETRLNSLLCAPTGTGKTLMAQLLIL